MKTLTCKQWVMFLVGISLIVWSLLIDETNSFDVPNQETTSSYKYNLDYPIERAILTIQNE